MASMRVFQIGLRRAAAPGLRIQPAGRMVQRRLATSQAEGAEILAKQRLNRPVSPHLTIYKPQITMVGSGLNRVTGVVLSGSLYLFGFAYLAAPYTGWHLETQAMVAAVAAWPAAVKVGIKAFFATPFFFHSINGLRHLSWDLGIGFKNATVIKTGWTAVAFTALASLYYTFGV
ncbi:mitochondrial succinate dehydrogenase cytochrome b560 subunit C [Phaeosphaeriaceae sp. PMI808]|nr:mitochondrial succinate dehydrogenase cytochrome b560 subunit C [Phaeosphaeriaceae sp. PMI808]